MELLITSNFFHIWHVFLTEVLLCQSFFTGTRAFVVNVQTSVMHPSVTIYRPQCSCICRFFLCMQSIRNHFPDLQQVIPRQYRIHNIFFPLIFSFFFFFFSFFGCFMHYISSWCIKEWLLWFLARLEVILITLRVVTFFTPFPQVGVVSRLTMHPVMLSSLAAFLTSNNCDNRRHHTNHDPFFLQWKLYCSYGFWCFVCSW